jgi:hypothetical protein
MRDIISIDESELVRRARHFFFIPGVIRGDPKSRVSVKYSLLIDMTNEERQYEISGMSEEEREVLRRCGVLTINYLWVEKNIGGSK